MATRDAAMDLARAHMDLAKAEFSAIGSQIALAAGLVGCAIASLFLVVLLFTLGTALFLGEWLLGSMGWGVLHGILFFIALAIATAVTALGVSVGRIARSFIVAVIVAVVIGVALGMQWPNEAYAAAGESARLNVDEGTRPLVVGVLFGAWVGLLIGFIAAVRLGSWGPRIGAIVALAILGAILGAISAITFVPQVGAGLGITVGYIVWIALMGVDVARNGIAVDDLKDRFYPTQTIETGKETLEWLQRRMPPGIGS
jgi:hypothetical protein